MDVIYALASRPLTTLLLTPVVGILGFVAHTFIGIYRKRRALAHIPGPTPHGIKGNVDDMNLDDLQGSIDNYFGEYGETYVVWMGPLPWVMMKNDKDLNAMMVSDLMTFDRGAGHELVKPWLGPRSIVNINNKDWVQHRKIFNQAFHHDKINKALPIFWQKANKMKDLIMEKKGEVDMCDVLLRLSTDVTSQWAFGYDTCALETAQHSPVHDAIVFAHHHFYQRLIMGLPNWIWEWGLYKGADVKEFNRRNKAVYDIIYRIIDQRLKEKPGEDATDLLSILIFCDTGRDFTRQDLAENMYTLFTATMNVPCVLEWCLARAHKHPHLTQKMLDELKAVVGDVSKLGPEGLTPKHTEKLTYMKRFVQECLRLHCPVTNPITKNCTKDFVLPGTNTKIPANTNVGFNMYTQHHSEKLWGSDVEEFDPDRFSEERSKGRSSFAYMPFEIGRRACLGQHFAYCESIALLAHILLHMKIVDCDCSWQIEKSVIARPTRLTMKFAAL